MTVWILLSAATLVVALCCAGVAATRGVYARLHFTAPAAILAPVAVSTAVFVEEGISSSSVKALLVALTLLVTNPILVHATARAARTHEERG